MQGSALSLATKSASRKLRKNSMRRSAGRESRVVAEVVAAKAEDKEGTLTTSGERPRSANPTSAWSKASGALGARRVAAGIQSI